MRLLICGSRDWNDRDRIKQEITNLLKDNQIEVIIHGGCRGADLLADSVAKEFGIPVEEYLADWNEYGKFAGPKRNQEMLDTGKPTFVIAFHNDINQSKGTKDMINRTKLAGVNYKIIS